MLMLVNLLTFKMLSTIFILIYIHVLDKVKSIIGC